MRHLLPFIVGACAASQPSFARDDTRIDPLAFEAQEALRPMCFPTCGEVWFTRDDSKRNAFTTSKGRGEYVISYSQPWLEELRSYGVEAALGLFAHELGHAIDYTEGSADWSPWERELSADWWAGCALGRRGMDVEPAIRAWRGFATESESHPGPERRAYALSLGADSCRRTAQH